MYNKDRKKDDKSIREFELRKLEFEKALDQRKFEIENFWKRGWFFGALILAVGTLYFQAKDDYEPYRLYIAFLGLSISFFQGLMNRGSKYWQERWEAKTKRQESLLRIDLTNTKRLQEREKYFLDAGILAKAENILSRGCRYSVSKLTILIWDLITLSWLMIWIANLSLPASWGVIRFVNDQEAWIVHLVYVIYIGLFWVKGKVWQPFLRSIGPDHDRYNIIAWRHSERYLKGDETIVELVKEELEKNTGNKLNMWQRFKRWIR